MRKATREGLLEYIGVLEDALDLERELTAATVTLRDQFAMAALTAVATIIAAIATGNARLSNGKTTADENGMAEAAYAIADAMLRERAK